MEAAFANELLLVPFGPRGAGWNGWQALELFFIPFIVNLAVAVVVDIGRRCWAFHASILKEDESIGTLAFTVHVDFILATDEITSEFIIIPLVSIIADASFVGIERIGRTLNARATIAHILISADTNIVNVDLILFANSSAEEFIFHPFETIGTNAVSFFQERVIGAREAFTIEANETICTDTLIVHIDFISSAN